MITKQKCIQKEIKSKLNAAKRATMESTIVSSRLLSRNVNIEMYITIISPAVLYGCESRFLTLQKRQSGGIRETGAEEIM